MHGKVAPRYRRPACPPSMTRTRHPRLFPVARIATAALLLHATHMAAQTRGTPAPDTAATLTAGQRRQLHKDLKAFARETDSDARHDRVDWLLDLGPAGATALLPVLHELFDEQLTTYDKRLASVLPAAYLRHLASLDDDQLQQLQRTRRLWRSYALSRNHRNDFASTFLDPILAAAQLVRIAPASLDDEQLREQRDELTQLAQFEEQAIRTLGKALDPTAGRTSPTGIAYVHLDQPPTLADRLHHHERTMVLMHTVAPAGARPILRHNDAVAREIDVQEAEFVLAANEARMLAGTIAWQADALGCAVARDHSQDRTLGRAKGHMSDIPEKRGFTHRCRRMGARRFGSEGAGGGRDGRQYLRGLSYGGGHTGPLYSLLRNVVGVGRRGGAYTSMYATDDRLRHDCQLLADELALPPGMTSKQVRGDASKAFERIRDGNWASAWSILEHARRPSDESQMVQRFLRAAIVVEVEWLLQSTDAIAKAGDVYEAHRRLQEASRGMRGLPDFDAAAAARLARFEGDAMRRELAAGAAFYALAFDDDDDTRERRTERFREQHAGTTYARAAAAAADGNWFASFLKQAPDLEKWDYPPERPDR